MDLVSLTQDSFAEVRRYSNYSMMAWNLTWPKGGDFQYRTYDVASAMGAFQKGHIVGNSEDLSVMQITEMTLSTDNKGVKYVELKGETPLNIFDYRPAQPEILTNFSYDAEYPDGWEFGDPFSNFKEVEPLSVAKEVLQKIDIWHYGRPELSYLKLPFVYVDATDNASDNDDIFVYEGDNYAYYAASGTVGDVLDELCLKGEFGMFVERPNYIDLQFDPIVEEGRCLGVTYYKPIMVKNNNPVSFDDLDRDNLSSDATYRLINNVHIQAREDFVKITKNHQPNYSGKVTPPHGITARVDFTNRNVEDLTGVAYYDADNDLIEDALREEKRLLDVSLETNGIFTNSPKKFLFGAYNPSYFLGDRVYVKVSGMDSNRYMRVKSFIRTQDHNGYREYPEFEYDSLPLRSQYYDNFEHHQWN